MSNTKMRLLPGIMDEIRSLATGSSPEDRKDVLQKLTDYIHEKQTAGEKPLLNFICTHNSRRSQLAQVWAQTAAAYYGVEVDCFSGGVEVTAFNPRAVEALKRAGFQITQKTEGANPVYEVRYALEARPIEAFSKIFDDPINPDRRFAAVMTCSDADENCPFIPGAEKRIALNYEDPKAFDGTPRETEKYDERSRQIATELLYVFAKINS